MSKKSSSGGSPAALRTDIRWPPEIGEKLLAEAKAQGLSPRNYIRRVTAFMLDRDIARRKAREAG